MEYPSEISMNQAYAMRDPRIERADFYAMMLNLCGSTYNVLRGTSYSQFVYRLCYLTASAQLRWATSFMRAGYATPLPRLRYANYRKPANRRNTHSPHNNSSANPKIQP